MKNYLIFGGLVLIGLVFVPSIIRGSQDEKLRKEIDRVASISGVKPAAVYCRKVEMSKICYAEYTALNTSRATQMLTASGYTTVDQQYNNDASISATNKNQSVRIDSEPTSISTSTITLKFKDIKVTL